MKPFTHWTEKPFVSHLVTLGAQLEVFGPLVVAFGASNSRVAVLALYAILASETSHLQIELLDFSFRIVWIFDCSIKRS